MSAGMGKGPDAFRTISEVAEDLDIPQHVLRFWETRFATIRPLKRGGGRRYYRPDDVELLRGIRQLLYGQGYTIKGVQRILKESGPRFVQAVGRGEQVAKAATPALDDDGDERPHGEAATEPAAADQLPAPYRSAELGLGDDDRERLRAALDELLECERILASLRDP